MGLDGTYTFNSEREVLFEFTEGEIFRRGLVDTGFPSRGKRHVEVVVDDPLIEEF